MKNLMPLIALLVSTPLLAQNPAAKAPAAKGASHAAPASNPGMTAARSVWRQAHMYVMRSAEQMPEDKFSYKPTPEVRSFGEVVGHVAGSEFMFCAAAVGDPERAENAIENTAKTKVDLIEALKQAGTYCEKAYAMTDVKASKTIQMFGSPMSVLNALTMNAAHDYEHYGNIVTYLRMNKMVPPSSQPARQ